MFVEKVTRDQLDRGEGIKFHPVCGALLSKLLYCNDRKIFYTLVFAGGWTDEETPWYFASISNGRSIYAQGTAYPSHWSFDPITGEEL